MSSTTDRASGPSAPRVPHRDRDGQVLVIFALSLGVLILFAALAFDTGMMLVQRRDQQNAADAAALAGSYFLPGNAGQARNSARDIATANGFTQGGDVSVTVNVPPTSGPHAGSSGAVEVLIDDNRPSIFGGIIGVAGWDISARAVAINQDGLGGEFAMLALEPSACDALLVSGNGAVTANGNIQVNSTCTTGALRRQGGGDITVTASDAACNVVGDIQDGGGSGVLNCARNEGATAIPDPLSGLDAPAKPGYPADVVLVSGTRPIPAGCPGAVAPALESTEAAPLTCQFTSAYAGSVWRLYPGYYPGGLHLQAGTFYFEPGIYWIGGGGVQMNGNGTVSVSVASGGTTLNFGILFYNSENPAFHAECAAGTATAANVMCIQPIFLNGAQASVDIYPLHDGSIHEGLVVFQDRRFDITGDDLVLNGSSSDLQVRGTIYIPGGNVRVNGSGGTTTTDQIIARTFVANGAPGSSIRVLFDENFVFKQTLAGLIE